MATQNVPVFSPKDSDSSSDQELQQEMAFASRGCCAWFPCFSGSNQPVDSAWERIDPDHNHHQGESDKHGISEWWDKGLNALKKVREWSELVAGPKWKTFIRRFNKAGRSKTGKFQYDPLSYALNFDEGPGQTGSSVEDDRVYRDFSSRYAAFPASAKSSMDLGKDAPLFT